MFLKINLKARAKHYIRISSRVQMQMYRCAVHHFSALVETKLPSIGDGPEDSVRRINSGKGEMSKS
jgi:hypothetical protein